MKAMNGDKKMPDTLEQRLKALKATKDYQKSDEDSQARQVELVTKEFELDEKNKTRTGVGTRLRAGMTRGKNPTVISWEAFDDSLTDTLPKSIKQFMEVTATTDESKLTDYLIVGFNDSQYSAASDEIGEYLNPEWDAQTAAQFRLVVRNYNKLTGTSIEDTVALMKPGIEKAFASKRVSA